MPYVSGEARDRLNQTAPRALDARDTGELTYVLTGEIEAYRATHGDCFLVFASIVAALEQAKDEFRRRVVHPYEDRKLEENGEVYGDLADDDTAQPGRW